MDRLVIPQHNRTKKTITLIKVFKTDFDCSAFVKELLDCLNPEVEIRVAFSFIMSERGKLSYVHAIPARPVNQDFRIIRDKQDQQDLVTYFKGFSYSELLHHAFHLRNTNNPFAESGFRPEKLVTGTFWITKWTTP